MSQYLLDLTFLDCPGLTRVVLNLPGQRGTVPVRLTSHVRQKLRHFMVCDPYYVDLNQTDFSDQTQICFMFAQKLKSHVTMLKLATCLSVIS